MVLINRRVLELFTLRIDRAGKESAAAGSAGQSSELAKQLEEAKLVKRDRNKLQSRCRNRRRSWRRAIGALVLMTTGALRGAMAMTLMTTVAAAVAKGGSKGKGGSRTRGQRRQRNKLQPNAWTKKWKK